MSDPNKRGMTMRVDYRTVLPAAVNAMATLEAVVHSSSLDRELLELVKVRASQLNGCAYCVDMHTKDAQGIGMESQRLHLVVVWPEAPVYSSRERAALAWCEALVEVIAQFLDVVFNQCDTLGIDASQQGGQYFRCELNGMQGFDELVLGQVSLFPPRRKRVIEIDLRDTSGQRNMSDRGE